MSEVTISPNMNMPVPDVGQEPGPVWAQDINACLSIIDQHDHSPGKGVQLDQDAFVINGDMDFNGFSAIGLRSVRFQDQPSVLIGPSDLGCLYEVLGNLYYNDGTGLPIQITNLGAVVGTPGSIAGLVPPASATYVGLDQTFVWQSGVNLPANMDFGSAIFRNLTVGSEGITVSAPAALATSYNIVWPVLPVSPRVLSIDSSGNMATGVANTVQAIDLATDSVTAIKIQALAVTTAKIDNLAVTTAKIDNLAVTTGKVADAAITQVKIASNIVEGTSSGAVFTTASTVLIDVPSLNASITVSAGKNVRVLLESDGSAGGYIRGADGAGLIDADVVIDRDGTAISYSSINMQTAAAAPVAIQSALSSVSFIDTNPGAGSHTYKIRLIVNTSGSGTGTVAISQAQLVLEEC